MCRNQFNFILFIVLECLVAGRVVFITMVTQRLLIKVLADTKTILIAVYEEYMWDTETDLI